MGCGDLGYHGNLTFLALLLVSTFVICCHGNKAGYKHLQLGNDEILVDQIIPLEDQDGESEAQTDTHTMNSELQTDTQTLNEDRKDRLINKLIGVIDKLKKEMKSLQRSQAKDRDSMKLLEKQMEDYHKETIMSNAEVVQIRQLVSENFYKIQKIEEQSQDNSMYLESLEIFQKDTTRDLRRFKEYRERAAKRFHQLENHAERLQKFNEEVTHKFNNVTQEIRNLTNGQTELRDMISVIHDTVNTSIILTSQCCVLNNQSHDPEKSHDHKSSNKNGDDPKWTNQNDHDHHESTIQNEGYSNLNSGINSQTNGNKLSNQIEIMDFGSGEISYNFGSDIEEGKNGRGKVNDIITNAYDNIESSGETVFSNAEGSGEFGSGVLDELIPVMDLSRFMEVKDFQTEILRRDNIIQGLLEKNQNLSTTMSTLEERLASIQLGSFMHNLQESLMNFTQNVITLDQWKLSSTQIVNSTLNNQDQIFKLTSMILENADQLKDLKWKLSNAELSGDQQYRVLRMHIIRLNNSVEDIKEQLVHMTKPNTHRQRPGYQSSYYGYQTSYYPRPGSPSTSNTIDENDSTSPHGIETIISRLDELGLQIVYNQNRLGNLEVKVLNESLYQCRKQNIDSDQDYQIAQLEAILKTTVNSLALSNTYTREVDEMLKEIDDNSRTTQRRVRTNSANIRTLRKLIPIMVDLRREVKSFLSFLPSDCQEYHERGYRKSGVYVIHPFKAIKSSHVTCYFDQSGGWTVLQQRYDGSQDFNKNWTSYREGFGEASSEYWIGNNIIYLLTANKNYSLRIDMTDTAGNQLQANYKQFNVSNPNDKSTLSLSGFYGNITDSFSYSSDMGFSTQDVDNDASSTNCAFFYEAGWWYKHCQTCNLNGRYDIGFLWFNMDTNSWIQLKASSMKIIPS